MKYSSRFFLYAPLGVFLLLFAIAGVHWWILASALSDRLTAMNGREVMPGVTLQFASKKITGFPFSLDTQFHEVSVRIATASGATRWQAEKFAMHALTYGRDETIFEAAGHQTLQWNSPDGILHTLPFAVGSLRASAILKSGALSRFDFDLVGWGSKVVTAQRLQFHARQNGADDIELLAVVEGMRLPHCPLHPNGIDKGELRATLSHVDALAPLLMGDRAWALAVSDWRRAGGKTQASTLRLSPADEPNRKLAVESALSQLEADQLPGITALTEAFCTAH